MLKYLSSVLALSLVLVSNEQIFGVEVGERVVAAKNGKAVSGIVLELISGDSKAVIKTQSNGGDKNVVILVDDVKYVSPPIVADAKVRRWTSANGEFSIEASMVSHGANAVYLQRRDGIVITANTSSLSSEDQSYVKTNAKRSLDCLACSGDFVEIVLPEVTPANKAELLRGLKSSLARSGYSVSPNAKLQMAVSFVEGNTEKNEMVGLNGKQTVEFTSWTTNVEFKRDDAVLWKRTHTTKAPYTLPGGEAGIEKLKKAEDAMVPFLRTLGIPPEIGSEQDVGR